MALDWLDDFKRPETPLEALERALEYARNEERWTVGRLFRTAALSQGELPEDDRVLCESVQACALGILVIACFDGPAVRKYFMDRIDEDTFLKRTAASARATKLLARALRPDRPRSGPGSGLESAISLVVGINDDRRTSHSQKHKEIVQGFERAVDLAREEANA